MSSFLAQHGQAWTIIRLTGPIAADADRLVRHGLRDGLRLPCAHVRVRDLVGFAFGHDVGAVVSIVVNARDLSPAAELVSALVPVRRYRLARAVLDGVANRAPESLLSKRSTETGDRPERAHCVSPG